MHVLAYIVKEWDAFVGWLEALMHIHQTTGSLPPAPAPGTTVGVTSPPAPAPSVPVQPANLPAGVTYMDQVNCLFKIDAADAIYPGQLYCVRPDMAGIAPDTQAFATGNWNSSSAKMSDEGLGLWARVDKMVPAKNADGSDGWTRAYPMQWIENAWSIGAEFDTWDKAIAQAVVIANRLAHASTGSGSGFVPHH
jgi:hypothetical protein